eukprot:8687581-Alexandrium_andersonii.AAC.2
MEQGPAGWPVAPMRVKKRVPELRGFASPGAARRNDDMAGGMCRRAPAVPVAIDGNPTCRQAVLLSAIHVLVAFQFGRLSAAAARVVQGRGRERSRQPWLGKHDVRQGIPRHPGSW